MPTETMIEVAAILAVFACFSAILLFGDLTWQPRHERKGRVS